MPAIFENPLAKLFRGDVLETLAKLPSNSVHTIITSPPYWGLRSYSGEQECIWDATEECQHEWESIPIKGEGYTGTKRWQHDESREKSPEAWTKSITEGHLCSLCSAWRGALGQEPTVEMYIAHLMEVMEALWRVLRDDGVCWVNLDCTRTTRSEPITRMRLKQELSAEQEQYVLEELAKARPSLTWQSSSGTKRSKTHGRS